MKTKEEIWKEWCEKDLLWTESILGAMQEYADQFQPSEVMPSDSILDLKQYVTNLLYFAYTQGNTNVKTPTFDKWVEEMIDGIDGYFKSKATNAMPSDSGLLTFEQCLLEEFLFNTQNYPEEYHNLFNQKFNRASLRFKSHLKAQKLIGKTDIYNVLYAGR